ncbi:MAG: M56 family metallopeptidase, partial [Pirellulales bacterium]|nr:M56 family metallopeptidase [Pirellulales bacterium]
MSIQMSSSLNHVSAAWTDWMLAMGWQVAVLVLVLLAVTWLLRGHSARLRYALWMLVPVRLLLPPTLAFATGWAWWLLPASQPPRIDPARSGAERVQVSAADAPRSAVKIAVAESNAPPNRAHLPDRTHAPRRTHLDASMEYDPRPDLGLSSVPPSSPRPVSLDPGDSASRVTLAWQSWLMLAWLLGAAWMLIRLAYGMLQSHSIVRVGRRRSGAEDPLVKLTDSCRQSLSLRRSVALYESKRAAGPMLVGWLRPAIVLPMGIEKRLSGQELEAVILHELNHVLRHDALVSLVQSILNLAYFFHPCVWIANRMIHRLREDACDEATLATATGNRHNYGSGLVKVVEMMAEPTPGLALGVAQSQREVARRLRRILDPRCPVGRRLSWTALLFVIISGVVLLPSAAQQVAELPAQNSSKPQAAKSAQQPQPAEAKAAHEQTFRGVVLDPQGRPVPNVRVVANLLFNQGRETTTNADGEFVFDLEKPNSLFASTDSGRLHGLIIKPWAKDETSLQQVKLAPTREVVLEVVDGQGRPVPDAMAGLFASYRYLEVDQTDSQGRVRLHMLPDLKDPFVFALRDGVGADYRAYVLSSDQLADKNAKAPALPEGPIGLTLDGTRPVRVKVIDNDDQPVPGIEVYPWYITRPDQPEDLNFSYFLSHVKAITDENGEVSFDWMPRWQQQTLTFWPKSSNHSHSRGSYDPQKDAGQLTLKIDRLVSVSGRVLMPDGSPAAGVDIVIKG